MKSKVVAILWEDACSVDEWESRDELLNGCSMIFTVGIIVEDNKKELTLALNHDLEGDAYSCRITIPKSCIVKRVPVSFKLNRSIEK